MWQFIVGIFLGSILGVICISLFVASSEDSRREEKWYNGSEESED